MLKPCGGATKILSMLAAVKKVRDRLINPSGSAICCCVASICQSEVCAYVPSTEDLIWCPLATADICMLYFVCVSSVKWEMNIAGNVDLSLLELQLALIFCRTLAVRYLSVCKKVRFLIKYLKCQAKMATYICGA